MNNKSRVERNTVVTNIFLKPFFRGNFDHFENSANLGAIAHTSNGTLISIVYRKKCCNLHNAFMVRRLSIGKNNMHLTCYSLAINPRNVIVSRVATATSKIRLVFMSEYNSNCNKTRGPWATTRSPEWNRHCRYADGMQHFSNTLMKRQWLKQFLKYLAYKVKMLKFSKCHK